MSMSAEHAEALKNEVAVVCCRTEAGTIISADNLEDPDIFPDMVDSGLLTIPSNCLKVGEVVGAKLTKTIDSLTPLTPDIIEGAKTMEAKNEAKEAVSIDENAKAVLKLNKNAGETITAGDLENPMYFEQLEDSLLVKLGDAVLTVKEVLGKTLRSHTPALTPVTRDLLEGYEEELEVANNQEITTTLNSSVLKIKIAEGRGIDIELPLNMVQQGVAPMAKSAPVVNANVVAAEKAVEKVVESVKEPKKVRELIKKHFAIKEVKFGETTKIEGTTLYIREDICKDAVNESDLVKSIKIDIITPDKYNTYSDTIMVSE